MDTLTTGPARGRFLAVAALGWAPARFAVPFMVVLPRLLGTITGRPSPWPMIMAALPGGETWLVVLGVGRSVYFAARVVNFLRIDKLLPRSNPGGAGPLTPWRLPVDRRDSPLVLTLPHPRHRHARQHGPRMCVPRSRTVRRCRGPTKRRRDERQSPVSSVPLPRRPLVEHPSPSSAR